jgi:hypothetical protein
MKCKKKDKSRLKWFRLDVDDFLDDPRMQHLTTTEKALWLLLLTKSFRNAGVVVTRPEIVAQQVGCSTKAAKALLAALFSTKLIIPIPGQLYEATSPRMVAEYNVALAAYNQKRQAGKQRAAQANRDDTGKLTASE